MTGTLDRIVAHKRQQIAVWRAQGDLWQRQAAEVRQHLSASAEPWSPRPIHLKRSIDASGKAESPLHLLTEIKLRSPSAGPLSRALSVAERAQCYEACGASLISVLCDEQFFDGSYAHLTEARQACSLPILCKEFVLDEVQLDRAVAFGADAVLLIVRCLTDEELQRLLRAATERSLTALVEVHTPSESERALRAGSRVVGVNARDLNTLEMDAERARRILDELPQEVTAVHLSGIKSPEDVRATRDGRADAALIGETLMRQDDPSELLSDLVAAARPKLH